MSAELVFSRHPASSTAHCCSAFNPAWCFSAAFSLHLQFPLSHLLHLLLRLQQLHLLLLLLPLPRRDCLREEEGDAAPSNGAPRPPLRHELHREEATRAGNELLEGLSTIWDFWVRITLFLLPRFRTHLWTLLRMCDVTVSEEVGFLSRSAPLFNRPSSNFCFERKYSVWIGGIYPSQLAEGKNSV